MIDFEAVFCDVDDFCQVFLSAWRRQLLTCGERHRQRACRLTLSEILTILIVFRQLPHLQGFLGARKDYGSSISMPHKKPRKPRKPRKSKNNFSPQLTEIQKQENLAHSKIRIAVENAIGGMKHFYCLNHRIRNRSVEPIDRFLAFRLGYVT